MSLVPPREISETADAYLAEHPELYQQAVVRAQQMGWIGVQELLVTPDWWGMFGKKPENEGTERNS
jgi:hypothetical protein